MQKIPTLFKRDGNFKVTNEVHDDCGWVQLGIGIATEKLDGTNVRLTVRSGTVVRIEKRRNPNRAQKDKGIVDPWYGDTHYMDKSDGWIIEAAERTSTSDWPDGEHSCEALGPKIQGNPLGLESHICAPFNLHASVYELPGRSFDALREFLANIDSVSSPGHLAEGIVFHHPDGRRAKIKRSDF